CIVPDYRGTAAWHARFSLIIESRRRSSECRRRTESAGRMDPADAQATDWTRRRFLWHRSLSWFGGHRLEHRDRPALGRAGASRSSAKEQAAGLLVEPNSFFERQSPGNLLHLCSGTAYSDGGGLGTDRVTDVTAPGRHC